MINIINPEECSGCSACAAVCPHNAIKMLPDALGFLYPKVEYEKCVECGLCEKVCSFNADYDKSINLEIPDSYAVRHKNLREVETSRSGAAFIAISDYVLDQGGVVYGAGYTESFRVVHKRAATKKERDEFKGSKYVQSDINGVFRQVKNDLKRGILVLFTGTPCQTSGLRSYIGTKYVENLLLVDIVCHGVPAPFIWRDYKTFLERKVGRKIIKVDFRNKQIFGWTAHKEYFCFHNGTKMIRDSFTYLFYKHIMLRHSCKVCYYCNTIRPSDMTLADFWGWEKVSLSLNSDDKGVSLVFVNTEKGRIIFEKVRESIKYCKVKIEDCLQTNLRHPTKINPNRYIFERDYETKGFNYILTKYGNVGWRYRLKRLLGIMKRRINSILGF